MHAPASQFYEFGDFRIDTAKRRLFRGDGTPVALTPRVFDTLAFLVEHPNTVLDKEMIMEAVWPDSIVEENNLTQNISTLRHVFGETPRAHRYIVTVPGRGYRFIADVRSAAADVVPAQSPNGHAPPVQEQSLESSTLPVDRVQSRLSAKWFAIVAVAAAVVVLSLLVWLRPYGASAQLSAKSIAVLPFENLSDDKQNSYIAAGVQDEILTDLASIADLKVTSRTSANMYAAHPASLRTIAQQLGVSYLLEGSVQRAGDRLRVHAQLIDGRNDAHVWAHSYEGNVGDVFAIQSEIAHSVAAQLQATISPRERAVIDAPATSDVVANTLYVHATKLHSPADIEEMRSLLEQAVARDPSFVRAWCALSNVHLDVYSMEDHTNARRELAHAALEKAIALQPDAGEVDFARAKYAYYGFLDYDQARAELELARRSLPNSADLYRFAGQLDRRQGRWNEALRNYNRALELDPLNPSCIGHGAGCYDILRRYAEARRIMQGGMVIPEKRAEYAINTALETFRESGSTRELQQAIAAYPPDRAHDAYFAGLLHELALATRDAGAMDRAAELFPAKGAAMLFNVAWPREWMLGLAAQLRGDVPAAQAAFTAARTFAEKNVQAQSDYGSAWAELARIDAALGRKNDAIAEARRACELTPVSNDPVFGAGMVTNLAAVYALTGEKDLALEQLAISARIPAGVHYGELKLYPEWDSLRGDPRFEQILASLAPK